MNIWAIAVPALLIGTGLLIAKAYAVHDRKKNTYAGFGWTLSFRDGKVFVGAVHPKGPAHRAGITPGAELHCMNQDFLRFTDPQEFRLYLVRNARPRVGDRAHFILVCDGKLRELTLTAELVRKPKAPPAVRDLTATMRDPDIRQGGMAYLRVGDKIVILPLIQLSDDTIMRL